MGKPEFERTIKESLTVKDLFDIAASAQFAAFYQISSRADDIIKRIKLQQIPITGVHLVGGVSCNSQLRQMLEVTCENYELGLLTCPKDICVDNGAMIAWNAWEIKNAE